MGIVIHSKIVNCLENRTCYGTTDKYVINDGLTYSETPLLFLDASNTWYFDPQALACEFKKKNLFLIF